MIGLGEMVSILVAVYYVWCLRVVVAFKSSALKTLRLDASVLDY